MPVVKSARGFTLVEALVAMLVLSLGLLGAWALQIVSLQGHADAARRAFATELARDLAERIRANPAGAAHYDTRHDIPQDAACVTGTACDATELAVADLAQFQGRAQALFPGEESPAIVHFEPAIGSAAADRFVITLRWRGRRDRHAVTLRLMAQPVAG